MDRFDRLAVALLGFGLVGCYTLQPIGTNVRPEVGTTVALGLNDGGRVALVSSMGPEIDVVEGRLVEQDADGFVIAVTQVHLLRGGVQFWSNESVRINGDYVRSVSERRFSRGRTIAAGAAGVGGFAFIVSRGLLGFGIGDGDPVPTDSGEALRIIWP